MKKRRFGNDRIALHFGDQKINLHTQNEMASPKAANPQMGSLDICFKVVGPLAWIQQHLLNHGIGIEAGPVMRTGALGAIESLYIRDPDGNLIELSCYDTAY